MFPADCSPRILVTRTDRIGDLVLSTPVFSELRKKFPNAHLAALTFVENREILLGNPSLDEVILYDKKGSEKGWWGNLRFARRLAAKKFDAVIHLHSTNRMHLVGWLAGIPKRIGWKRKNAWCLTHAYPDLKKEGKKHEAEYNFDLLESFGVKAPVNLETFFPISPKAESSLQELFRHLKISGDRPWVVLHPAASCPSKRWPAVYFGELADRLTEKYKVHCLLVGSEKDRGIMDRVCAVARNGTTVRKFFCHPERSEGSRHPEILRQNAPQDDIFRMKEEFFAAAQGTLFDLSGRLSLAMLGVLLKKSALLISNDSGPVHIATAVGTPVVSIFGRNQAGLSPERWRPLGPSSRIVWKDVGCKHCLAHLCEINFLCLEAISVEDVLRVASPFLERIAK